ncbi:hypothetical protein HYY75_10310 [bacterium]|nr:hypothetical protein [bacterium]
MKTSEAPKIESRVNWKLKLVLILGLIAVVIGLLNHETEKIFLKATTVCLQCIGIG